MLKCKERNETDIIRIAKKLVSHACGQTIEGNWCIELKLVHKLYFNRIPWDVYRGLIVPLIEGYIWQDERVLDVIVDGGYFDINVGTIFITENFESHL